MKLLIIEDHPELNQELYDFLHGEGYVTETALNFAQGEEKIALFSYDLLILDITLPDGNGLELLRKLKQLHPETGVIILSAKNSLDDKIVGLDLGADDYMTKPFHFAELNARIRSLIRRRNRAGNEEIEIGTLTILPDEKRALIEGQEIPLTKKEFELLLFFTINAHKVISKQQIAEHLWGDFTDAMDDFDFIYTHIKNLRKKISAAGESVEIKTVYGLGYQFVAA